MVAELRKTPVQVVSAEAAPELPALAKPAWTRGLTLAAHHFQAQDRYHEELVRFALRMTFNQPWGVTNLVLDEDALAAGEMRVRRLSAIFPDGTPILVGGEGIGILSRSFEGPLRGRPSLDVFVALPMELPGLPMAGTKATPAENPRYVQETATVADYNTGRNPMPLPWGRPNARLLFESESLDGSTAIRIARVLASEGRAQLDPHFIPPVLRVQASPALQGSLRAVERSALAAKAVIGETRVTGSEMTGNDAARLLLASALGRSLPALQSVLGSEGAHPRDAYRVVAELVGSISAFTPAGAARVPAFDYLDLRATFEPLEAQAREIPRLSLRPHPQPRRSVSLRRQPLPRTTPRGRDLRQRVPARRGGRRPGDPPRQHPARGQGGRVGGDW